MNIFTQFIKNKFNHTLLTDVLACDRILNWFVFDIDAITPCCEMPHNGELNISLYDHDGNSDLLQRKIQLIKNINHNKNHICRNCYRIKKYDKIEKKDFTTTVISLSFDKTCNIRCSYCFMSSPETRKLLIRDTKHKEHVRKKVMEFLDTIPESSLNSIGWTGGEPFLLPEFDSFYSKLVSLKPTYLNIYSNLTTYHSNIYPKSTPESIGIMCSIDAGTRETYLKIKGKDYFYNVVENIKKYCDINPDSIYIKYLFCEYNSDKKEIDSFINIMKSCGVIHIFISLNDFEMNSLHQDMIDNMIYFITECKKYGFYVHNYIRKQIPEVDCILPKSESISI